MSLSAIPPAAISAAAAAARGFLRSEAEGEAATLERLAATAILLGEAFTGTVFVRRDGEEVLSAGRTPVGWQALSAAPVTAIAGLTALVAGGAPFVLAADAYAIDIDRAGTGWVRVVHPDAAERVAVAYRAGLADTWETMPAPIAHGVVALIAHLFEDRSAATQPPAAVAALWRPYRRLRLGCGMRT